MPSVSHPKILTFRLGELPKQVSEAVNGEIDRTLRERGYRFADRYATTRRRAIEGEAKLKKPQEVIVEFLNYEDLGLGTKASRRAVYAAALAQGYDLCPEAVGLELGLRIDAVEFELDQRVIVATNDIQGYDTSPRPYLVAYKREEEHPPEVTIGAVKPDQDHLWTDTIWVFMKK